MKDLKVTPEIQESGIQGSRSVKLNQIHKMRIQNHYKFEKKLGEGAFGKVHVASLLQNPNKKFAIKSIQRD